MGMIKKQLEPDFFIDPRPLADGEKKMISDFIKADKEKRKRKKIARKEIKSTVIS